MKGMKRLTLIFVLGYFASGCWLWDILFGPSGFTIKTTFVTPPSPTQRVMSNPDPNVQVVGNHQGDNGFGSPCGNTFTVNVVTDSQGKSRISDGRGPAIWNFGRNGGHCGLLLNIIQATNCGGTVELPCSMTGFAFTISPDSIDINAPPPTATLSGQGLSTAYGMPSIEYYDEYGDYFAQTNANNVSPDGTWLEASIPSLVGLYSGVYTMVILNATWDGSREVVGTATVWAYGNDPPPPDPNPDPCYNNEYRPAPMECYPTY